MLRWTLYQTVTLPMTFSKGKGKRNTAICNKLSLIRELMCHIGSPSVMPTCHPIEVTCCLYPSHFSVPSHPMWCGSLSVSVRLSVNSSVHPTQTSVLLKWLNIGLLLRKQRCKIAHIICSFLTSTTLGKFHWSHLQWGHQIKVAWKKYNFQQIARVSRNCCKIMTVCEK